MKLTHRNVFEYRLHIIFALTTRDQYQLAATHSIKIGSSINWQIRNKKQNYDL